MPGGPVDFPAVTLWPVWTGYATLVIMGGQARVCPRCGAGFDVPPGQGPVTGGSSTAAAPPAGSRIVSIRVDGVIVHQCQQRVDLLTGKTDWRPARTVGADPAR